MTTSWRHELQKIDEAGPSAELFQRAASGPRTPERTLRRIERRGRRAPVLVLILAVVLFAGLAILAPQRLANARQYAAPVAALHSHPAH